MLQYGLMKPLRNFIDLLGGQKAVADALGLSPDAVHYWCKRGAVPGHHLAAFGRLLAEEGHQLAAEELARLAYYERGRPARQTRGEAA